MHELELARIVEADRRRGIAESARSRRPRYLDDGPVTEAQAPVTDASAVAARTAGLASAAAACTASSRTSTSSSRP